MRLCNFRKYIDDNKGIVECDIGDYKAYFTCEPSYIEYCQDNYDGFLVLIF